MTHLRRRGNSLFAAASLTALLTATSASMRSTPASTTVAAPAPPAPTRALVAPGPGSSVWFDGTSNVHDFTVRSTAVGIMLTRAPGHRDPVTPEQLVQFIRSSSARSADVQVPIASLHSGRSGLDKNMRKALRADRYPTIQIHVGGYTVHPGTGDTLDVSAEGRLTIGGEERPVTLRAHAYRGADGVWIDGTQTLRMSEFKVSPPRMLLGTMRVNDPVTVHWHVLLAPQPGLAQKAGDGRATQGGR